MAKHRGEGKLKDQGLGKTEDQGQGHAKWGGRGRGRVCRPSPLPMSLASCLRTWGPPPMPRHMRTHSSLLNRYIPEQQQQL